ncbi:alpha/beta hydrolase, partial [Microbacterium sp. K33]|uniref:alpha/beta hydrolase n=1 Tax=Microbacterium sp. K33 TaxID=2305441 RepID=UPI001F0FF9EA
MDETTRMLELLNASFPRLATMDPLDGRAAADERIRPATNLDDVAATDDGVVDAGTHGIPIRTYHPRERRPDAPTTVYAHGGGFLHGSIAGHDGFCRRWARATGATVVSVDYRLAPEAGPGAARDDVIAAAVRPRLRRVRPSRARGCRGCSAPSGHARLDDPAS